MGHTSNLTPPPLKSALVPIYYANLIVVCFCFVHSSDVILRIWKQRNSVDSAYFILTDFYIFHFQGTTNGPTVYAFSCFFFTHLQKNGYEGVKRWTKNVR